MERRDVQRRELRIYVDHILSEEERCLCMSEDLSPQGLKIQRLPGQRWGQPKHVWLQLRLPGELGPIRALGELRYEGEQVRGFRFKYINPKARHRYERFLESHTAP